LSHSDIDPKLEEIANKFVTKVKAGKEVVKSVASGVWNGVKAVGSGIVSVGKSIISGIGSFFGGLFG